MKIYLADLIHDYFPGNYVVPLNIGLIKAYLQQRFNNELEIHLFKSPKRLLDSLKRDPSPNILAFSNYTWNQELNRRIMQLVKSNFPDTILCSGGPHIRTENEGILQYLQKHNAIDYYCMFEGEIPLGNLIEFFLQIGRTVHAQACEKEISSVAYLRDGKLVYPRTEFKKGTIEDIPSPYLTGVLDEFIRSSQWVPILETNRGCPFSCTFCVWGISAMDKIRVFPLERILEEISFVAKYSPSPRWIFADANFGILPRDVEIARKIKHMADQSGVLRHANLCWAKNSSRHTLEISHILGSLSDPLAAVQTMDEKVLKAIKRDNIKLSTITDLLEQFHKDGIKANTDVLAGLPGESKESHLETLRKTFNLGFDYINVGNIRVLPGSEMETDKTRRTYQLKTKYRLISGSYGRYHDMPIFEYEESVRSSKEITENEMHSLRLVHFFIWAFWNLGIAKPLLRGAQVQIGLNPLDLILELTRSGKNSRLDQFIFEFDQDAWSEWFDSPQALTSYYTEHFDELIKNGFLKMNFKYLAKLLLDKVLTKNLLQAIADINQTIESEELIQFCMDRIYFLDQPVEFKQVTYSDALIDLLKNIYPNLEFSSNQCQFEIDSKSKHAIHYELKKYRFEKNSVRALALTLESYRSCFLYDFKFGLSSKKEIVGDLTSSFDYHAPFGLPKEEIHSPS